MNIIEFVQSLRIEGGYERNNQNIRKKRTIRALNEKKTNSIKKHWDGIMNYLDSRITMVSWKD